MSDENLKHAWEVLEDIYKHERPEPQVAILEARDRAITSAARAEGEAAGYARAVEEIATWVESEKLPNISTHKQDAEAIRAKFGGK